jgi:glutamine amidotransferase
MVHNGTIFNYSPLDKFFHLQKGDTDSERILLYIVEEINKAQKELERPLTSKERFNKLDEIVSSMSSNNKLNLLIFDGHYIYVHTNCKNTLYYLEKKEGVIISTRPLSSENWQNVPFTTLLAYKEGKLKYTGTNHQNEFIENEESMKFLYQIFSDL